MDSNDNDHRQHDVRQNQYLAAITLACRRESWLPVTLALVIGGMLLFGYLSLERTHHQLEANLNAESVANGVATAAHVGRIIDDAHRTLRSLAGMVVQRDSEQPHNDEYLITLAEQLNRDHARTGGVALIDERGQAYLLNRSYAGESFDVSERPYLPYARLSPVDSFSYGPPTRNMNTHSINIPVMLKIVHNGRELILATALVQSHLHDYLSSMVPGASGLVALVQRADELGEARILSMSGGLGQISGENVRQMLSSTAWLANDGHEYLLETTDVGQTPFTVVTGFSHTAAHAPFGKELGSQLLLLICAVLLMCLRATVLLVFVGRNLIAADLITASEQHFRDLVEGSLQGIWIQRDFRPLFVNEAALEILGYDSEEEFLALPGIESLIAEQDLPRLREYNDARLRGDPVPDNYEFTALRKDGGERVLLNAVRVIDWHGLPAVQCAFVDITEAHDLAQRLTYEASHDELTALHNRRAFIDNLKQVLGRAPPVGRIHVLLVIDLDQFKVVNDTCGHASGDELLRQFADILRGHVREQDIVARLGGDEFAVLLRDFPHQHVERFAQTLIDKIGDYCFVWEDNSFKIGISIGIAPIDASPHDIAQLMSMADNACYTAKQDGRNRFHVYDTSDLSIVERSGDMRWLARFDNALERDDFYLVAQPVADLQGHTRGRHFELLLRMVSANGDAVFPGVFLPTAERYHVAPRIDRWVLDSALGWLGSSDNGGDDLFLCNINISAQSMSDKTQREYYLNAIRESGVMPGKLCFEITETAAMANVMTAVEFMRDLRQLGCQFALDDFGSGLSSFGYLKSLPVDYVKIDGQFVKTITTDPANLSIVRAIHQVGKATGKQTVAECVEDEETLELLRQIGIDFAQGYHVGRPRALDLQSDDTRSIPVFEAGSGIG